MCHRPSDCRCQLVHIRIRWRDIDVMRQLCFPKQTNGHNECCSWRRKPLGGRKEIIWGITGLETKWENVKPWLVIWPRCGEEAHFMCVCICVTDRQTVSMYRDREMCVMFGLPSTAPLIDPFRAINVLLNYCPLLVGSPVLSPEVCKQTWLSEKHSAHISCYPVREIRRNKKGLIISPLLSAMAGRSQTFSRQIALTPQWAPCICVCVLIWTGN